MTNRSLKIWAAWIAGIVVLVCVNVGLTISAEHFGLPTWIDYGETIVVSNRYYDEERDGRTTSLGLWIMFVSISLAARAGMAVVSQNWNGGVSKKGNMQLAIFLVCMSAYALIVTLVWEVFKSELMRWPVIVGNLLDLGSAGGLAYLGYKYYQKREDEWTT